MDLNELEIREYLIGIAKEKRTVNYKIIMDKCGENTYPSTVKNKLTKPVLDPISEKNINQKEPLLAALVVNKNTGIPGDDFFNKWTRLPMGSYPYPPEGPENQEIHELELKRIYDHWQDENYKTVPSLSNITPISDMPSIESLDELNDVDVKKSHTSIPDNFEKSMIKKSSIVNSLNPSIKIGMILGLMIGLVMNAIIVGFIVGLVVGSIIDKVFKKENESALYGIIVGAFIGAFIGVFTEFILNISNFTGIGFVVGGTVGGIAGFKVLFENKKIRVQEDNKNKEQVKTSIDIKVETYNPLILGVENPVKITVINEGESTISNVYLKTNFPKSVICNETAVTLINEVLAKSSKSKTLILTPTVANEIDLGDLIITLKINGNSYEKEPIKIGIFNVTPPEINIQIDAPNPLKIGIENPVKITVINETESIISNVHLKTNFPKSVIYNGTIALIDEVPMKSSESKTLFVIPTVSNEIDFGDLKISLEINGNPYEKEPVKIGIFDVIPPEIDIQIDVLNPLKVGIENPVKITVKNQSDILLSNVQIETHFSRLITCDETTVHTDDIPANSSEYTAIFITPRIADKIDLGDLHVSSVKPTIHS